MPEALKSFGWDTKGMPAPKLEEVKNRIAAYLDAEQGAFKEADITRKLFYDEKAGAQTAHTRVIYKALDILVGQGKVERTRKKEPDGTGEYWAYSSKKQ